MKAVRELLGELGLGSIPAITVFNKSDLVERWEANALALKHDGVAISAAGGEGLGRLVQLIAHRLWQVDALPEDDPWAAEARREVFGIPAKTDDGELGGPEPTDDLDAVAG